MSSPTTHTEDALTEPQRKQQAGEFVDALKPFVEPLPPMVLHQISAELAALQQAREEAEDEGALPDTLKTFDVEIQRYVDAQLTKGDGIAHVIHAEEDAELAADREIERVTKIRNRHRARKERIKTMALYTMQTYNVKSINRLSRRLAGGKQTLEADLGILPDQYQNVSVKMPLTLWRALVPVVAEADLCRIYERNPQREADNERIRAALAQSVLCPECKGDFATQLAMTGWICPRCENKGTIPQSVPGARLLPRSEHLRVE